METQRLLKDKIASAERSLAAQSKRRRALFVLLSGGVDSSLSVMLAVRAGLAPIAVTMRQMDDETPIADARALCRELGIEHVAFDLREEFETSVVRPFREAYLRGETPNPCALCNPTIKFGRLWERIAAAFGSDDFAVSTGHYAKTCLVGDRVELHRGADRAKDQSYFLCMLPAARVDRLVLPLGAFSKNETRQAVRLLAPQGSRQERIAQKEESMEICFLASENYRSLLPPSSGGGQLVDETGAVLGTHPGIGNFTIGQRKGLGITTKEPMFVVAIHPATDTVVVAPRSAAMRRVVRAHSVNVLAPDVYRDGARLMGRIRSQSAPAACTVAPDSNDRVAAVFDEPQFAPAPGQYLALYREDRLIAGGIIETSAV